MQYNREVDKEDQEREDLTWRMHNIAYFWGGGVLLLRNPYDALRLFFGLVNQSGYLNFQEFMESLPRL